MGTLERGEGGIGGVMIVATAAQIRMARAALRWTSADLAERAGLSRNAVNAIERGGASMVPTMIRLQTALEQGGVTFIEDDGRGPGVRFRPR
jgi:transcriptional regulator with XRE-family HTH domain